MRREYNDASLARYNSDGSLDNSFGTGGKRTFDMNGASNDMINEWRSIRWAGSSSRRDSRNITIARVLAILRPRAHRSIWTATGNPISRSSAVRRAWWILKSSNGGNAASPSVILRTKLVPGILPRRQSRHCIWRRQAAKVRLRSEDDSFYSFPFGSQATFRCR